MKEKTKRAVSLLSAALCLPMLYKAANKLVLSFDNLKLAALSSAYISYGVDSGYSYKEEPPLLPVKLDDIRPYTERAYTEQAAPSPENDPIKEIKPAVRPENAGNIVRKTYKAEESPVYIRTGDGFVKNCTALQRDIIEKTAKTPPDFKIKADGSPEVLIMHTHATESYGEDGENWFEKDSSFRTTDCEKNMVRVGDEIESVLKAAGIGVIHNKTLHDYPSYNGSYERSAETVKRILKENPSIKVVLDIHRDAIQPDAETVMAPVCEVDGKSAAQLMIISGCDNGKMNMPNYLENLKFSATLQRELAAIDVNLARPVLFDYRKYNQDLTTGSILVEVGGHGNSLSEAVYSGELLGRALVNALNKLKQV